MDGNGSSPRTNPLAYQVEFASNFVFGKLSWKFASSLGDGIDSLPVAILKNGFPCRESLVFQGTLK
jgi:hypothetical protein